MSWRLSGTYVESCNCDAICPCRRVDDVLGGRSTHGFCAGVLTWRIDDGRLESVALSGLSVAIAMTYDDDEEGSPWRWILYLDDSADPAQLSALTEIFTGRCGGDALKHFPWAWKHSELLAVRVAPIELDHTRRRQRLRVRDAFDVRIRGAFPGDAKVSCVIPGHHQSGEELVAEQLRVDDGVLAIDYRGSCAYAASFDYRS